MLDWGFVVLLIGGLNAGINVFFNAWPAALLAGAIGFIGNEIAAQVRLRAGKRLNSPALIADGYHARTDALVSLAVVASAVVVGLGLELGDPLIGLVITLVILRITWQSFQTIKAEPGLPDDHGH